jgi:hypothetical protein
VCSLTPGHEDSDSLQVRKSRSDSSKGVTKKGRVGSDIEASSVLSGGSQGVAVPKAVLNTRTLVHACACRSVPKFWTHQTKFYYFCDTSVREKGLAQPQACRAGDVSAASCLQVAAGEQAAATRLRQARPLSACTCSKTQGENLGTRWCLCLLAWRSALSACIILCAKLWLTGSR